MSSRSWAAGYAYLQTETGRRTLAEMIGTAASGPDLRVSVGSIGAGLPARIAVDSLALSDGQGPWLTLDRAVIEWRPLALLSGTAHVTSIEAAGFHLERLPPATGTEEAADTATAGAFEIPTLPIDVRVDRIDIRDIALAEAVAGEAMVLDLTGQVAAEAGRRRENGSEDREDRRRGAGDADQRT